MELGKRKQAILKAIIDDYISTAEPVGSKTVAERLNHAFSSATIRNEMADLEEMGYLEQPHTSAGRVPSPLGYRLYVNELMMRHRLSVREMEAINRALKEKLKELDHIIAEAGKLVSRFTNYTSYAVSPGGRGICVVRFDLFGVSLTIYTIVLVTDAHMVRNKLVHTMEPVDESALSALNAALNAHMTNLCAEDITDELIRTVRAAAGPGAVYLDDVLGFVREVCGSGRGREVYLTGASHLLSHPEYRDSLKARRLLEYLSDGQELTRLPEPSPDNPLQIIIGPENVAEQLRDASVVMASYSFGGNVRGLIGVVGPTRMDYSMVLSRLSYFVERLNKLLGGEAGKE